jgi:hypothetical protein
MVTQKMKPRGNTKTSYDPTFQSFFHQGKDLNLALHYFLYSNLRMRFYFKGGAVIPHVMNSLIMIISVLIKHQSRGVIKFQQTERNSN